MKMRRSQYFNNCIQYLLWSGVVIYDIENPWSRNIHRVYSFILWVICGYGYLLTEIIHVYNHFYEIQELTLTMCYLISHLMATCKVLIITIRRKKIGKFLLDLEDGVFLPNIARGGEEEQNIINEAVQQTNTQGKVFFWACVSMVTSHIIPNIFKTTETVYMETTNTTIQIPIFPYPSTLPFSLDVTVSPYYEIAFIYQTFSMSLFGWYIGNCDVIVVGLMRHARAQFKIVINAMLTVTERAQHMTNSKNYDANKCIEFQYNGLQYVVEDNFDETLMNNLRRCVKDCVKHHMTILDLLDNMENTFSLLLLIVLLSSLLTVCVGLYQTSLLPFTDPSFISMASFTIAIMFQLLVYCWSGNEVSLYSMEVASAAYNCSWLRSDRDVRRSLCMIMQRAQRASYLTAGGFSKMSLETFMAIVRGSVSYFMVLRQMNEELEAGK